MRVRQFVILAAGLLIALAGEVVASPRSAWAQAPSSQWVIVPGEGWGPIRLGMTEQEVYAILGSPSEATGQRIRRVGFLLPPRIRVTMRFGEPGAAVTQPPRLVDITMLDGPWRTPEGVGIGSSLSDVLKTYADTMSPPFPGHAESCLDLQIFGPRAPSRVPPTLALTYPRGVIFQVNLSTQKVNIISVEPARVPPECP